jgi:hypothetical protein
MSASAVEPPRHLLYPFVVALAENVNQQHITACIDPVGGETRAAIKPEISIETSQ